jgi:hypothetical protein
VSISDPRVLCASLHRRRRTAETGARHSSTSATRSFSRRKRSSVSSVSTRREMSSPTESDSNQGPLPRREKSWSPSLVIAGMMPSPWRCSPAYSSSLAGSTRARRTKLDRSRTGSLIRATTDERITRDLEERVTHSISLARVGTPVDIADAVVLRLRAGAMDHWTNTPGCWSTCALRRAGMATEGRLCHIGASQLKPHFPEVVCVQRP